MRLSWLRRSGLLFVSVCLCVTAAAMAAAPPSRTPWAPPTEEEVAARPDYDEAPEVPEGTILALPGPRFMDARGPNGTFYPLGHEAPVFISERQNTGLGTGLNTWDGALVLAAYLGRVSQALLTDALVVELGAGTGLAGIAAAKTGRPRHVLLTDLDYTLANLARSVALNDLPASGSPVTVTALDWFAPPFGGEAAASEGHAAPPPVTSSPLPQLLADAAGSPLLLLGADVVWVEQLIPSFVKTLVGLLEAGARYGCAPVQALLSHQTRSHHSDRLLVRLLAAHGYGLFPVPPAQLHPTIQDPDIWVFEVAPLGDGSA